MEDSFDQATEESKTTNIASLCRACARPCEFWTSQTPGHLRIVPRSLLADTLRQHLDIWVEQDTPELPSQICQSCYDGLENWKNLQQVIFAAQDFFRCHLDKHQPCTDTTSVLIPKLEPTNRAPELVNNFLVPAPQVEVFICSICDSIFPSQDELYDHQYNTHSDHNLSNEAPRRTSRVVKKLPSRPKRAVTKKLTSNKIDPSNYLCGNCDERFPNLTDFSTHIASHEGLVLICSVCDAEFMRVNNLLRHLHRHVMDHKGRLPKVKSTEKYSCGICKSFFESSDGLGEHINAFHSDTNLIPCALCQSTFHSVSLLQVHLESHYGSIVDNTVPLLPEVSTPKNDSGMKTYRLPRACQIQETAPESQDTIYVATEQDIKLYVEDIPPPPTIGVVTFCPQLQKYVCGNCVREFDLLSEFAKHFLYYHQTFSRLSCGVCGAIFNKLSALLFHEKRHKLFPDQEIAFRCTYCIKHFSSARTLSLHVRKHHKLSTPSTVNNKISCTNCPAVFSNSGAHAVHYLFHLPSKCPICYAVFQSGRKEMYDHLMSEHKIKIRRRKFNVVNNKQKPAKTADEKKYPCPICGKKFKLCQTMKIHMEIHSSTRNYVCEICAKSFKTMSTLNKHGIIHNRRLMTCNFCKREFTHRNSIRKHIMLHIKYFPYKCKPCKKGFVAPDLLRLHNAKVHENKRSYVCIRCKKAFRDVQGARRHMLTICKVPVDEIPYIRDKQFLKPNAYSSECKRYREKNAAIKDVPQQKEQAGSQQQMQILTHEEGLGGLPDVLVVRTGENVHDPNYGTASEVSW